ncbi:dihydrofolate reductase family protein [uncultured Bdellovibrio sp.]|uniref:dihydrofolate reductase family protein n=1 Tax=Bdellovibrio sp. HCB-162 TaxID=3394234 RepID=UPI0025E26672|nr:dihydrofolate reductase family protein [uncultured Bdellovibrio sp.]
MGKLILRISVSIDGFIESSEEKVDFSKSRSPEGAAWLAGKIGNAGAHLMGRKAFTQLSSFWPTASGALANHMNEIPKIVFSRKGFDPSQVTSAKGWADAKVIGDMAEGLADLKKQIDKDLIAHGGVEFTQNLVQTGLVDEFWLATHPVATGRGFGLFQKLEKPLYLKLVESKAFATGAMMNIYRPE